MLALPRPAPGTLLRQAGPALAAAVGIALLCGCGVQSRAQQIVSCKSAIERDLRTSDETGKLKILPPQACKKLNNAEVRKLLAQLLQQPLQHLQTP
ncbi:MAG TPA: hypothetical protein VGI64_02315 [Streptosporangiaceae bacterium]|jgi:ABC-type uncharacterized transport system auxiliary subunit